MRRVYRAPVLAMAGIAILCAIGAAGFATGLRARAAHGEVYTSSLPKAAPSGAAEPAAPAINQPPVKADWSRAADGPRSAALRYGILELLPAGFSHSGAAPSAMLRATLEAATDAAVDPPSWRRLNGADERRR
jgi:hypothetical protein